MRRINAQELLDNPRVVDGVTESADLCRKGVDSHGEVVDMLAVLEGDVLKIRPQPLRVCLAHAVAAEALGPDGRPSLLGARLPAG